MRTAACCLISVVSLAAGAGFAFGQVPEADESKRMVLVELYTSQGCDMCPEAERLLSVLAARNDRIVPIAFHVDYFNDPWHDPFSDELYSQRQMAYNAIYTKPKNPEYGVYYTPMLMIDGEQSVNGREPDSADAAVRQALRKKPQVTLDAKLDPRAGKLEIKVAAVSPRVQGRSLLVCAVVRDDQVVTRVRSGENANKTLTNRFPARLTKFEDIRLQGEAAASVTFPISVDPSWKVDRVAVVIFIQDKETGSIYQSAVLPWAAAAPKSNGSRRDRKNNLSK